MDPALALLEQIAGGMACVGFLLLLLDLGWPSLLDWTSDMLDRWRALVADAVDWADCHFADSERRWPQQRIDKLYQAGGDDGGNDSDAP